MKKISVVLVGAGLRGETYTNVMLKMPEEYQVIAVAEPRANRRENIRQKHNIPENMCFEDYEELFALGKIADLAVVCTQDQLHYDPAMKAIELGYDLMLEKPISNDSAECIKIARAAEAKGIKAIICTQLRYTSLFNSLKRIISEGQIGDVITINHEENVGNVHQSHSFVRGNWGNTGRSSCMLLQKSCHDLDLLAWLMDKKCTKIQSFGSLNYFKAENMPEGAPERCIDGCPHADTCPYNAVKLYLDDKKNSWFRGACTNKVDPTDEDVEKALRTTMYGMCVYRCDNDVVDHQTVNMLFEDNTTATFTMAAFNKGGRFMHIMGTKGEIHAAMADESYIKIYDFETKKETDYDINGSDGIPAGHGGGDEGIVRYMYRYLSTGVKPAEIPTIGESCRNHVLVFAAEEARLNGTIVDVDEFISRF